MNRKFIRTLSAIISVLMLLSSLSVIVFAAEAVDDEFYYETIRKTSYIVNPDWADKKPGDDISYFFRDKTITTQFVTGKHFSSYNTAYAYAKDVEKMTVPSIILTVAAYEEQMLIQGSVKIFGANAGINPNNPDDVAAKSTTLWAANSKRSANETTLQCEIKVPATAVQTQVEFDGVSFSEGSVFTDTGTKEGTSKVIVKNSVFFKAGSRTVSGALVDQLFHFTSTSKASVNLELINIRATKMRGFVIGPHVSNVLVDGLCFSDSTRAFMSGVSAKATLQFEYTIKNSGFFNTTQVGGLIDVNSSVNDTAERSKANLNVEDCVFNNVNLNGSPISFKLVGIKNKINVTGNTFISTPDVDSDLIGFTWTAACSSNTIKETIVVTDNILLGYTKMPDTLGLDSNSRFDYTGNFIAEIDGETANPVYPTQASALNITIDYSWLDMNKTVKTNTMLIKSTAISGATIDHDFWTIDTIVNYGDNITPVIVANNFDTNHPTTYKIYSDEALTQEVTSIDTKTLDSGEKKNVFYVVGTLTNSDDFQTDYQTVYTMYVSTYDPRLSIDFSQFILPNAFYYDESLSVATGTQFYVSINGQTYKMTAGINAFNSTDEIFARTGNNIPNIILSGKTYSKNIVVKKSANILGAKYGINPNIPQFTDPDKEWPINPQRDNVDQETTFLNATISTDITVPDIYLCVDGITLSTNSAFADFGAGLTSDSRTTLKNIIVNGAGDTIMTQGTTTFTLPAVFNFCDGGDYLNNHKTINFLNIRMEKQPIANIFFDRFFETLIIDGLYYANNIRHLHNTEWTAPKDQNMYLEVRNSFFKSNTTTTNFLIMNPFSTTSAVREYEEIVFDHNMYYDHSQYAHGLMGIRFSGPKTHFTYINNTAVNMSSSVSSNASFLAGGANWFLGDCLKMDMTLDTARIEYNRSSRIARTVDMSTNTAGSCWDYSNNFFCAPSAGVFDKSASSVSADTFGSRNQNRHIYENYYTNWDLTTRVSSNTTINSYLDYTFYKGTVAMNEEGGTSGTYVDTVTSSVSAYTFDIEMNNDASYVILSGDGTNTPLSEPLNLKNGENKFILKIYPYEKEDKNAHVFQVTINKPIAVSKLEVESFGNWRVTEENVYVAVPIGQTSFVIPEITVTEYATFDIYNDAACTSLFTGTTVTGITQIPTFKFIKVSSPDKSTSKVYAVSFMQAENDQTEVTKIPGAVRTSSTTFTAFADSTGSFLLTPEYSSGTEITAYYKGELLPFSKAGDILVGGIGASTSKEIQLVVTSISNPQLSKSFTVTITADNSTCEIIDIKKALIHNTGFNRLYTARVANSTFDVEISLANTNASYKLFADKFCTKPYSSDTIPLSQRNNDIFIRVTAADGITSRLYRLNVVSSMFSDAALEIENAVATGKSSFLMTLPDNTASTTITPIYSVEPVEGETIAIEVFSDIGCTKKLADNKLNIAQRYTYAYVKVTHTPQSGTATSDIYTVKVDSKRTVTTFKDQASIPSWALNSINELNNNGLGIMVGDENGNFNPGKNMTRYEIAVVACKTIGCDVTGFGDTVLSFADTNSIPSWALPYVKTVSALGLMNGNLNSNDNKTYFDGNKPTQRQQLAKIMVDSIFLMTGATDIAKAVQDYYSANSSAIISDYDSKNFADADKVPNWALISIQLAVSDLKIMNGSLSFGLYYINPTNFIKRQEVAVMIKNCYSAAAQKGVI